MFNKLFGPSVYLLILDLFLENPDLLVNLREIAKMIGKNPGSVSRVIPRLVENDLVKRVRVGKFIYVYCLNKEKDIVQLLVQFRRNLNEIYHTDKEEGDTVNQ